MNIQTLEVAAEPVPIDVKCIELKMQILFMVADRRSHHRLLNQLQNYVHSIARTVVMNSNL